MIHELPAAEGAPPPLVHVGGAGPGLVEVALLDVVLTQVTQQLALGLGRESDLEKVELAAADGVIPVDNSLRVIVIHEYMPEYEKLRVHWKHVVSLVFTLLIHPSNSLFEVSLEMEFSWG